MSNENKTTDNVECAQCGTTSELTPVIKYIHQGEEKYVCTHCLPMLIHG